MPQARRGVEVSTFIVSGPDWLDEDNSSCETCGHWSSFDAGFEYNEEEGYVQGWYSDEISCYNWAAYDSWLYGGSCEDEDLDTVDRFREFLTETDSEEAQQILDELNRLGL